MGRSLVGSVFSGALITVIGAIASADDVKDEAINKDRKKNEGTSRIVAIQVNGTKAMDEDAKRITVVDASDGTWSIRSEGKEKSKGTSIIDPAKKLKTIDFIPTEGDGKGKQSLGIYEISEKTRRLCFAPPGAERPTEFVSTLDSKHILVTFEREPSK
jgi:uncharacterized protein (TIGR03067 family)